MSQTSQQVPGSTAMISAPLDQPAASIFSFGAELVLQRGEILRRVLVGKVGYFAMEAPDLWIPAGPRNQNQYSLSGAVSLLGVRPILVTFEDAYWRERPFLIPSTKGPVIDMMVQELGQTVLGDSSLTLHARNVSYICEAVAYHCRRLALLERDIVRYVESDMPPFDSTDFVMSGQVEPYFEVEALITAIVRAFDTIRLLLWKAYGNGGSPPTNFERVLAAIKTPPTIANASADALARYRSVKEYRDCIQHYAHFGARLPFARIHLVQGIAWSVFTRLPDNPEAKSYSKFTFDKNLDAMDIGWEATTGLLQYSTQVLRALKQSAT